MFKENSKAIFLQIADRICDDILAGTLGEGDRMPSVREYAANVQVNPNTVMRTYEMLSAGGIIFNRRGIGFFVAENAPAIVRRNRAAEFLDNELFSVFRQLSLLGVSPDELKERYENYLKK